MKLFIFSVLLLLSFFAQAKTAERLHCKTQNMEKEFDLYQDKIAFYEDSVQNKNLDRKVASIQLLRTGGGQHLFKMFKYEGDVYTVEVKNLNKLDWTSDYLSIRSKKGHEITYPIKCQLL